MNTDRGFELIILGLTRIELDEKLEFKPNKFYDNSNISEYDKDRPDYPTVWITLPECKNQDISPLEILRRIFPKDIDDYYMNLAKLYFEFAKQSREFHQKQEYTDKLNITAKTRTI